MNILVLAYGDRLGVTDGVLGPVTVRTVTLHFEASDFEELAVSNGTQCSSQSLWGSCTISRCSSSGLVDVQGIEKNSTLYECSCGNLHLYVNSLFAQNA